MRRLAITALLAALIPSAVSAQSVSASTGVPYATAALDAATTLGADLGGLRVTATFADGATSTADFGNLGDGRFGVLTDAFRLSIRAFDDTFLGRYTLTNLSASGAALTGLDFRGAGGGLVFDRTFGGEPGTEGSFGGADFEIVGAGPAGTTALYTNAVRVGAGSARGDLYERLLVAFGSGGLTSGVSLAFIADVDAAASGAAVTPVGAGVVPEPRASVLLGAGLLALGGAARPRRRTA